MKKSIMLAAAVLFLLNGLSAQNQVSNREIILILQPDLSSVLYYNTVRNNVLRKQQYIFDKDNIYYVNPNEYKFIENCNNYSDAFEFTDVPGYAILQKISSDKIKVDDQKIYTYSDEYFWDNPSRPFYDNIVFVFILPNNFEYVEYKCSQQGEWVKRQNVVTYFGKKVNNLKFSIRFKPLMQETIVKTEKAVNNIIKDFADIKNNDITVKEEGDGVKVTFRDNLLFKSGSAEIMASGKLMLDKFVDIIKNKDSIKCIISGHTDNVPISTDKFPSNWELSAARSLSVVHYLVSKGVNPEILEGDAFGEYHPIATNETDAGRAMNRRIELTIVNDRPPK